MKYKYWIIIVIFLISCNSKIDKRNVHTADVITQKLLDSTDTGKKENFHITIDNVQELKTEADSYYEKNHYSNAILLFNELINMDSTKGEYYFKRGYSNSMMLNIEDAIKDYLKSAELKYRISTSYQNIGANYATINDSLAAYYLNKSLKYDPNNKIAQRALKNCNERLNKRLNN